MFNALRLIFSCHFVARNVGAPSADCRETLPRYRKCVQLKTVDTNIWAGFLKKVAGAGLLFLNFTAKSLSFLFRLPCNFAK